MLYKGDGLRSIIHPCYSWEMVLNFGLDASFDNIQDVKGIWEVVRENNSTKACATNGETSP
jgi:hypothetical protein